MKQVTLIRDPFHTHFAITHSILFQFRDVTFLFIIVKKKMIDKKSIHPQR